MGLEVSHGAWSGPVAGFNEWRRKIAAIAGLPPLGLMEGYYRENTRRHGLTKDIYSQLPIEWRALRPDPLIELLDHSDCSGVIPAPSCAALAEALRSLLPKMEADELCSTQTLTFIEGLEKAAKRKQKLTFS